MTDIIDFRTAISSYVQTLFSTGNTNLINGMRVMLGQQKTRNSSVYTVYTLQSNPDTSYSFASGLWADLKLDFTTNISNVAPDTRYQQPYTVYCGALSVELSKGGTVSLLVLELSLTALSQFLGVHPELTTISNKYKMVDLVHYDVSTFIFNSASMKYTGTLLDQVPLIGTETAEYYHDYNSYKTKTNTYATYYSEQCRLTRNDFSYVYNCPCDWTYPYSANAQTCLFNYAAFENFLDLYKQPDSFIGFLYFYQPPVFALIFILALSVDGRIAFLQRYPQYGTACCLNQQLGPMASGICPVPGNFLTTCDAVMDVICKNNKTTACACYTDNFTRCTTKECQNGKAYLNQNMRENSCPNQCLQIIDITGGQQAVDIQIQQAITGCVPQKIYKRVDSPGCSEGTGGTGDTGSGSAIGYDTGAVTNYTAESLTQLRSFLMSQYTKSPTDFFTAMSQNTVSFVDTVSRQPFVLQSVTATEPFDSGSSQLLSNSFQGWQLVNGALRETFVLNPNGATCQLLQENKAVLLGLSSINVSTNGVLSTQSNQVTLTQLSVDDSVETELAFSVSVTASTDPSAWGSDPLFPYDLTKGTLTTVLKGTLIVVAISPASNQFMRAARNRTLLIQLSIAAACAIVGSVVIIAIIRSSKKLYLIPLFLAIAFSVPIVMAVLNQLDTKSY